MTLIESKATVFGASRVSERRRLEWLAGTGVKDEFGLKEGAERGGRGEWGEIEQHIGSRKTLMPDFGDLYRFGVEMYTILHTILLWMCFFCLFFQPSVYKSNSRLFVGLFAQFRFQ